MPVENSIKQYVLVNRLLFDSRDVLTYYHIHATVDHSNAQVYEREDYLLTVRGHNKLLCVIRS
jgi:hypothetical protein